jgi:hypothetical protein
MHGGRNPVANRPRYEKKKHRLCADPTSQANPLVNRYHVLTDPRNTATNTRTAETTTVKPPPIFIYGVTNLPEMRKRINEFINEKHFTIKSVASNTIKLLCQNPDTFRKLVKYMKEKNTIHHTYQPKEERSAHSDQMPSPFSGCPRTEGRNLKAGAHSWKYNQRQTSHYQGPLKSLLCRPRTIRQ